MIHRPSAYQFSEYIKALSSPWVSQYFLSESEAPRRIVSSNVIENAILEFIKPNNLQERFDGLEVSEQLRCAVIYLTGNAGLLCERDDPLDDPLVRSFLIYAAYSNEGVTRLFGFDEFEDSLSSKLIETILRNGVVVPSVSTAPQWKYRPLNDVIIVSTLASQSELKKGKNGKFSRATILKLKKLIDTSPDSKSETTDFLTRLIITYCTSKGILRENEIEVQFNPEAMFTWMNNDRDSRLNDCKEFAIQTYGAWRLGFLDKLIEASESCWISLRIFPEKDREDAFNAIRALKYAGVIDYLIQDDMVIFNRLELFSAPGAQTSPAIVQADFTAVIPEESDPDEIFYFAQAGEILSLDKVFKGKLSKDILANSLSRGIDSDHIIEWLYQHQAPPNVVETVKEWIREFFRLFITERMTLVSGEEKVSRLIESYLPLKAYLEMIPAHAVYQIKRGCEEKVKEILTGLGFDYRKPGEEIADFSIGEHIDAGEYLAASEGKWKPVTEIRSEEKKQMSAMRGTKYGEELKALDMSEIIHVIDYAVLTGRNLILDYEGSPYIKPGVYTVLPLSSRKGMDPILDAELLRTKSRKQFYIKKIRKIGVVSE
jgi:hypothetical protein